MQSVIHTYGRLTTCPAPECMIAALDGSRSRKTQNSGRSSGAGNCHDSACPKSKSMLYAPRFCGAVLSRSRAHGADSVNILQPGHRISTPLVTLEAISRSLHISLLQLNCLRSGQGRPPAQVPEGLCSYPFDMALHLPPSMAHIRAARRKPRDRFDDPLYLDPRAYLRREARLKELPCERE